MGFVLFEGQYEAFTGEERLVERIGKLCSDVNETLIQDEV